MRSIKFRLTPKFFGWAYVIQIPVFACYYWYFQGFGVECLTFLDALYFSAVTITTLGYGDIQPIETATKLVSASEAVFGVVTIGFFLTSLSQRRAEESAEEQLAWLTGGRSFPVISPMPNNGTLKFLIRVEGGHHLRDLKVEFASDRREVLPTQFQLVEALPGIGTFIAFLELKTLFATTGRIVGQLSLDPNVNYDYAINSHAENGRVHQRIRVRFQNDSWEYSSFIVATHRSEYKLGEVLHMESSKGFDHALLEEDWPKKVGEIFEI